MGGCFIYIYHMRMVQGKLYTYISDQTVWHQHHTNPLMPGHICNNTTSFIRVTLFFFGCCCFVRLWLSEYGCQSNRVKTLALPRVMSFNKQQGSDCLPSSSIWFKHSSVLCSFTMLVICVSFIKYTTCDTNTHTFFLASERPTCRASSV